MVNIQTIKQNISLQFRFSNNQIKQKITHIKLLGGKCVEFSQKN